MLILPEPMLLHHSKQPKFSLRRALVLALLAGGVFAQCSFPDHRFSDVNCFSRTDAGNNVCSDPICAQSVKCVPPIPSGWFGPVALWRGSGSDTPPSCTESGFPSARFPLLYAGDDPSVAGICPACSCSGAPSAATARCETRVQFLRDSACSSSNQQMLGPDDKPGYVVGTSCTKIDLDTSQFTPMLYSHDPAYAVDNSCSPQQPTGQRAFPSPIWDLALRACDLPQFGGCTSGMCTKRADGVFDRSVCIYQEAAVACPMTDYTLPFQYFNSNDTRDCSGCTCAASGLECPTSSTVGDWASDTQCAVSSNIVPPTPGCGSYTGGASVNMKLSNATPVPVGTPACVAQGGGIVGSVTKGQAVTFCCISLE
jgi:hypothetical protein